MTLIKNTRLEVSTPTHLMSSDGTTSESIVGFTSLTSFYEFNGSATGVTAADITGAIEELALTPVIGWFSTAGAVNLDLLANNNKLRKLDLTANTVLTFTGITRGARVILLLRETGVASRTIEFPVGCLFSEDATIPIAVNNEHVLDTILCVDEFSESYLVFVQYLV